MELKTSLFIHPSRKADNGGYYLNYSDYENGEVLYLFTSYEEFLKCYDVKSELEAVFWYLIDFEDDFYKDTLGVIINPGSDCFFIPTSVVLHIICDIEENNFYFRDRLFPPRTFNDNRFLHDYLKGKKTLKQIANLFSYLDSAVTYTLIKSPASFGEGEIDLKDKNYSFFKIDSHYVIYTDKSLLKNDINDEEYFYYMVADAVELVKLTLEFDFEGIIFKTPVGEFTIPRKSLLKQYENLIKKYQPRENPHETAYDAGDL